MTAHVVVVYRRHRDRQYVGACSCGRKLESANHDDVADYLQPCRAKARTPHDSQDREARDDD